MTLQLPHGLVLQSCLSARDDLQRAGIAMPTLLRIEASPRESASISRKLTSVFVDQWSQQNSPCHVIVRDLVRTQLSFIDLPWIDEVESKMFPIVENAKEALKISDELIAELKAADRIVIGTPIYNLSIPAILKAYIDQIVRIGETVSRDNRGLLTGKAADVILATGGDLSPGSPLQKYDLASGYLRDVLRWIGISDVNVIHVSRSVAGPRGERAVEVFGSQVASAASRQIV